MWSSTRLLALAAVAALAVVAARVFGISPHGQWINEAIAVAGCLVVWTAGDFVASRHLQRADRESRELYEQLRREQFGDR